MLRMRTFIDAYNPTPQQIEIAPDKDRKGRVLIGPNSINLEDLTDALKYHGIKLPCTCDSTKCGC